MAATGYNEEAWSQVLLSYNYKNGASTGYQMKIVL